MSLREYDTEMGDAGREAEDLKSWTRCDAVG
jgi:hypothetical protein